MPRCNPPPMPGQSAQHARQSARQLPTVLACPHGPLPLRDPPPPGCLPQVEYAQICGVSCMTKSATRWWSSNDVAELSIAPNLENGRMLKWGRVLIDKGLCEKTAPKLVAMLTNTTKFLLLRLETIVAVHVGKPLKTGDTALEGDTFEFITGYDTVVSMATALRSPMTPQLVADLEKLAASYGQRVGAPLAPAPTQVPGLAPAAEKSIKEVLLEIPNSQISKVNCSINACFWNWHGAMAPQPRYSGKFTSWLSKETDSEQPRIKWEKGLDEEGKPQDGFQGTAPYNLSDLLKPECEFRLEPFDDGTPAPWLAGAGCTRPHRLPPPLPRHCCSEAPTLATPTSTTAHPPLACRCSPHRPPPPLPLHCCLGALTLATSTSFSPAPTPLWRPP